MREGEREVRGRKLCSCVAAGRVSIDPSQFAFVCDSTREEKNLSLRQESWEMLLFLLCCCCCCCAMRCVWVWSLLDKNIDFVVLATFSEKFCYHTSALCS